MRRDAQEASARGPPMPGGYSEEMFLVLSTVALACECWEGLRPVSRLDTPIPANGQIVVAMRERAKAAPTLRFASVGRDPVPAVVEARLGDHPWFVVRPSEPLRAGGEYRLEEANGHIVSLVRVRAEPDTVAPTWKGVRSWEIAPGGTGDCASPDVAVALELTPARDDRTARSHLLFQVWLSPGGGPIDYARPADTVVALDEASLVQRVFVGPTSACAYQAPLALDGPLRIGLRPMDLAGNLGPPGEVTVSLPPG